jgi:hypothetical protein
MATNQYQEKWFASAAGRKVDPDGVWGFQCVDAPKDYFEAIFGVDWLKGWPGRGNACDMFGTASTAYFKKIRNDPNNPNLIPERGDIIVWEGTAVNGVNPYGHIAIVLSANAKGVTVLQQDGFLQAPIFVGTLGYSNPGTGMVYGWLRPWFDTPAAPAPAGLKPNQRIAGPNGVKQRDTPSTSGKLLRTVLATGKEEFTGYVHGQSVTGTDGKANDVWFKDDIGYCWSGGFNDTGTAGLVDLTPAKDKPIDGNQRVTGKDGVIRRKAWDKNSVALESFVPDRVLTFKGYVRGTAPYGAAGTDVWFVGALGTPTYFYAGAFTDQGTHDLPDLTAQLNPAPAPGTPAPAPVPAYSFTGDFDTINGIKVEVIPAASSNVDIGNFPKLADCKNGVFHWWNDPSTNTTVDAVVGEFKRDGSLKSVQLVITHDRIIQMVKFGDRAYHAKDSNIWWGAEVDPRAVEDSEIGAKIRANAAAAVAAVSALTGSGMTMCRHNEAPGNVGKTACNQLPIEKMLPDAAPPIAPAPEPAPADDRIGEFLDWLQESFHKEQG